MSKSSSFNSEELSDESLEEQDTNSQVDKDKDKDKEKEKAISTLKETIGIENLELINSI